MSDHAAHKSNRGQPEGHARQAGDPSTRIPVELVLRKLGEGASEADLLAAYPRLKRADIRAAQSYAADALAHEDVIAEPRRRRTGS